MGQQALAAVSWPLGELCEETSASLCPAQPLPSAQVLQQGGSAQLTPWAESLVFAQTDRAQLAVPVSESRGCWGDPSAMRRAVGRLGGAARGVWQRHGALNTARLWVTRRTRSPGRWRPGSTALHGARRATERGAGRRPP